MNTFVSQHVRERAREHSGATIKEATQRIAELAESVDAVRLFVAAMAHLA